MASLKPDFGKRETKHRKNYPQIVEYANENRKRGSFVDVTILVGNVSIPANRLILSCCSEVFEKMFKSRMKERYNKTVKITADVDVNSVKMIIEFIYTGSITITNDNVMQLLEAANYLQMDEIKNFCSEFLGSILTPDTCITILEAANLYEIDSLQKCVYQLISSKFAEFIRTDDFVQFTRDDFTTCISKLDRNQIDETYIYEAVVAWIKLDEENRQKEFSELLKIVQLDKLPHQFLVEVVSNENLIKENLESANLVLSLVRNFLDQQAINKSKILSVGGWQTLGRIIEVYNRHSRVATKSVYSDLPIDLNCGQSLKIQDCIYCIGGSTRTNPPNPFVAPTNRVVRLKNLPNPSVELVAAMKEKRSNFGAAVFCDCLVVAGGYSGKEVLRTAEYFKPELNVWKKVSPIKYQKSGNVLVTCKGSLYDIGGGGLRDIFSGVQQLQGLCKEWRSIQPMQMERRNHAAVSLNGYIYAIGGKNALGNTLNSVERFDPTSNEWVYIKDMNIPRSGHAACILRSKIFVVGGVTGNKQFVKEIESYDPDTQAWCILGQSTEELKDHSLIVL